jgi:hypothetical protein
LFDELGQAVPKVKGPTGWIEVNRGWKIAQAGRPDGIVSGDNGSADG